MSSQFCIMLMYCGSSYHTVMLFLSHITINKQNITVNALSQLQYHFRFAFYTRSNVFLRQYQPNKTLYTMLIAHSQMIDCKQTEGCLQFERKRIFNDLAINAAHSPRAVFNSRCDHEHAKCTRRARYHLSARHSICF